MSRPRLNGVLSAVVLIAAVAFGWEQYAPVQHPTAASPVVDQALAGAIRDKRSGVQVAGEGTVDRVLADDDEGSRHQRFILRLASGDTVLVAHNIDLAPRVPGLTAGDRVAFHGVYEWNARGGVIHWTHQDPGGRHQGGWLRHGGGTFE